MLTGTPLDLTPFGALFTAVGWLYWLLAAGALWWALSGPSPWKTKLLRALPVALVLGLLPGKMAWESYQAHQRFDAATVHFEMRCKSAGEKIRRTVDNVDAVVWMKWRDTRDVKDDYDQFKLFDPYGSDCEAEECIAQLLRLERTDGRFEQEVKRRTGRFRYVESVDPRDGQRYRYIGAMVPRPQWTPEAMEKYRRETGKEITDDIYWFGIERTAIDKFSVRYGITWDDISTREDRDHWIAGGSIKVIDLQTNEVIAERVGYMMDRALGSTAGFRAPWSMAVNQACPEFPRVGPTDPHRIRSRRETVDFIRRVVQPTK